MKFRVRYRRARVTVEGEKPWKCAACPRFVEMGAKIELHHYQYKYSTKMVREKPQLALEGTIPLCFLCHRIADMFKKMAHDPARTSAVNAALIKKIQADTGWRPGELPPRILGAPEDRGAIRRGATIRKQQADKVLHKRGRGGLNV